MIAIEEHFLKAEATNYFACFYFFVWNLTNYSFCDDSLTTWCNFADLCSFLLHITELSIKRLLICTSFCGFHRACKRSFSILLLAGTSFFFSFFVTVGKWLIKESKTGIIIVFFSYRALIISIIAFKPKGISSYLNKFVPPFLLLE